MRPGKQTYRRIGGKSFRSCFVFEKPSLRYELARHSAAPLAESALKTVKETERPARCWPDFQYGAGDGNRTRVMSLEGSGSTIEPHPHFVRRLLYRKMVVSARDSPRDSTSYASYFVQKSIKRGTPLECGVPGREVMLSRYPPEFRRR